MAETVQNEAETFVFRCHNCNGKLSAKKSSIGRTFPCPKCKANVTVPGEPDKEPAKEQTVDERDVVLTFVKEAKAFANAPLFHSSGDPLHPDQLKLLYDELAGDTEAYPGEVLALFANFLARVGFHLAMREKSGMPLPYPSWDDHAAACCISSLYRAMATVDKRFFPPFELLDEGSARNEPQLLTASLLKLIENFEPTSKAFAQQYGHHEFFSPVEIGREIDLAGITIRRRTIRLDGPTEAPSKTSDEPHASVNVLKCSHCGGPLSPHHRFCGACGKPVVPTCSRCGGEHSPNDRFCRQCGQAAAP